MCSALVGPERGVQANVVPASWVERDEVSGGPFGVLSVNGDVYGRRIVFLDSRVVVGCPEQLKGIALMRKVRSSPDV